MKITRGKLIEPVKLVLYGPAGVGKSSWASLFPDPLFIDLEQGTGQLDVARTQRPVCWTNLLQIVNEIHRTAVGTYKTVVLESADWAETLGVRHVCDVNHWDGLGGQKDFGHTYSVLALEFNKLLEGLTTLHEAGLHVVVTAHSIMKAVTLPDAFGSFDRYQLKLENKVTEKLKEWCDTMLFVNHSVTVVEDKKAKKSKGMDSERIMHCEYSPCWDAKNRSGLPADLDFPHGAFTPEIAAMVNIFDQGNLVPNTEPELRRQVVDIGAGTPPFVPDPPKKHVSEPSAEAATPATLGALKTLMTADGITKPQLQNYIANCGWYLATTPFSLMAEAFIRGQLLSNWPEIVTAIKGAS